jgi:chemotaxis protein methyltransferase CheR
MTLVRDITPGWSRATLGSREFTKLAALVHDVSGIALTPVKRTMLEGRLRRRLQANGLDEFTDYLDLLRDAPCNADEVQALIDAVTTNQTAFFREPVHFDHLADAGLRGLLASSGTGTIRAWSAACSSGEEPYTIAMVLAARLAQLGGTSFRVLATDISTEILATAARGIYRLTALEEVPPTYQQYFMRAKDPKRAVARIVPELRSAVRFGRLNLIDRNYNVGPPFEIIFCRNVLIYFDSATQKEVLLRLCDQLRPGGLLYLGHADTTSALKLPLRLLRANIYVRL